MGDFVMDEASRQRLARVIRNARGDLSQRRFAKKLGVSYTAIQSWESASAVPKIDTFELIAEQLEMEDSELLDHVKGRVESGNTLPQTAEELFPKTQLLSPKEQKKLIKLMIDARIPDGDF